MGLVGLGRSLKTRTRPAFYITHGLSLLQCPVSLETGKFQDPSVRRLPFRSSITQIPPPPPSPRHHLDEFEIDRRRSSSASRTVYWRTMGEKIGYVTVDFTVGDNWHELLGSSARLKFLGNTNSGVEELTDGSMLRQIQHHKTSWTYSPAIGLHGRSESDELLLEDPVSEVGDDEDLSGKVLFAASFEELARNHVQYDTVIWALISLLLVLAWGVGFIMLLYLPVRRYVLQKDIASRRLYVTSDQIVYKATRPSFLPFLGLTKIDRRIPLHLVLDIIIEQGCLQSIYGIHTFRIESIAHGKAAPVDELQFQGVSNPGLLRKVIVIESTKSIREVGTWKPTVFSGEGMSTPTSMRSLTNIPTSSRWQSPSMKVKASPRHGFAEAGGTVPGDLLLHKVEEIRQSAKKLESIIVGSHSQALQDDS